MISVFSGLIYFSCSGLSHMRFSFNVLILMFKNGRQKLMGSCEHVDGTC